MSVAASVVLTTARTLLNDDAATLWTDAVLFPKLAQAHRELQVKLRFAGSPVMRVDTGAGAISYTATTQTIASPADLVEPIKLFEKATTEFYADYIEMTEVDPLPRANQGTTLKYWAWSGVLPEVINLLGASVNRHIRIIYWRSLAVPTLNTDTVGFLNGELWLAPRTAAIAAGTVGNKDVMDSATAMAKEAIDQVILSNRGRLPPAGGSTARP